MKKLILLMLVAMVPFLTMAQKRSKKKDKLATEQTTNSKASVEYMMIKGVEIPMSNADIAHTADVKEMVLSSISSENVKLIVSFDYGDLRNAEVKEMMEKGRKGFRTMMSAVNTAAEKGWEFINSNVISEDKIKIHYYYMKRKKKK